MYIRQFCENVRLFMRVVLYRRTHTDNNNIICAISIQQPKHTFGYTREIDKREVPAYTTGFVVVVWLFCMVRKQKMNFSFIF